MLTPYMPQQEITVMEAILAMVKPRRVLEYGAGGSTARWAPRVEEWVSVEHDPEWFREVALAAPQARIITGSTREAMDYAAAPGIRGKFDLIFVDGLYRVECVKVSPSFLAPGGVTALHDASRAEYRACWDVYPHLVHLTQGDGRANGLMVMWL